jgi:hypothetical protein
MTTGFWWYADLVQFGNVRKLRVYIFLKYVHSKIHAGEYTYSTSLGTRPVISRYLCTYFNENG